MGGGFSSGDRGSLPVLQIFMSAACKLSFIAVENAHMIIMWKNRLYSSEFNLSNSVIVSFVAVIVFTEINKGITFGATYL